MFLKQPQTTCHAHSINYKNKVAYGMNQGRWVTEACHLAANITRGTPPNRCHNLEKVTPQSQFKQMAPSGGNVRIPKTWFSSAFSDSSPNIENNNERHVAEKTQHPRIPSSFLHHLA